MTPPLPWYVLECGRGVFVVASDRTEVCEVFGPDREALAQTLIQSAVQAPVHPGAPDGAVVEGLTSREPAPHSVDRALAVAVLALHHTLRFLNTKNVADALCFLPDPEYGALGLLKEEVREALEMTKPELMGPPIVRCVVVDGRPVEPGTGALPGQTVVEAPGGAGRPSTAAPGADGRFTDQEIEG